MVGPCWGGEVYGLIGRARVESGEKEGAQVDGAGTGDGLEAYYLSSVSRNEMTEATGNNTRFSLTAGLSAPSMSF